MVMPPWELHQISRFGAARCHDNRIPGIQSISGRIAFIAERSWNVTPARAESMRSPHSVRSLLKMIVIPTGTDAPIYHWPYATVGLIVLNVVLALLSRRCRAHRQLDEEGEVIEERETSFET